MADLLTPGIVAVAAADCTYRAEPWPFLEQQRDAIDAHWAAVLARQPRLFDGRVLMQTAGAVARDEAGRTVFRARYTDVPFRAFLAWRDFGHPVRGFRNGFAMAALQGADGAFLLGEMGPHTANAGRVYFPSGTPDLSDLQGTRVDIEGSVRRELVEETGLDPGALAFQPGLAVIEDELRVCFMKHVVAPEPAAALAERIDAALAAEPFPELVRMHVVRSVADITPAMPPFVATYLAHMLKGGA